jgi:hypothetical protein
MRLNPLGKNVNEVSINGRVILFSYKTPVAYFEEGSVYVTTTKWSRTTSKHITQWLNKIGYLEKKEVAQSTIEKAVL